MNNDDDDDDDDNNNNNNNNNIIIMTRVWIVYIWEIPEGKVYRYHHQITD